MVRPLRRSAARRRQLQALLCFPLLVLLHLLFTLFSLVLRLSEAFTSPGNPIATPKEPPRHVALVLLSGSVNRPRTNSPFIRRLRSSSLVRWSWYHGLMMLSWVQRRVRRNSRGRQHGHDEAVMTESARRMISWAGSAGVSELSIYDDQGLLDTCKDQLIREYQRLPVSPPESRSPSPLRRKIPNTGIKSYADIAKTDTNHEPFNPVTSFTVFRKSVPLNVHLLSQDSREVVAHLARARLESKMDEPVLQADLDQQIRVTLHFGSHPDLLIVHRTKPPSFLGALLPRAPPELGGFPFWPLRITEIYMHPVPLPLPSLLLNILSPLLDRSRTSSLSLLRKTAKRFPNLSTRKALLPDALREQEWEGAMRAWQQMEQRLGK